MAKIQSYFCLLLWNSWKNLESFSTQFMRDLRVQMTVNICAPDISEEELLKMSPCLRFQKVWEPDITPLNTVAEISATTFCSQAVMICSITFLKNKTPQKQFQLIN